MKFLPAATGLLKTYVHEYPQFSFPIKAYGLSEPIGQKNKKWKPLLNGRNRERMDG